MAKRRTKTQVDYAERILRVLVHIETHLDDELDLEELAGLACFSPFHFHRIFRGIVGEPIGAHLRRLRLERAARALRHQECSVITAALRAGYETPEAFSRAFRSRFGVSPSAFREGEREAPAALSDSLTPESLIQEMETMEVRIEELDDMKVAFVRHVGPYQEVGAAWGKLCGWAGPNGLFGPTTKMFGMSHDDPEVTPPERLRYDACIAIGRDLAPSGDVGIQTVKGGRYAVTLHTGPFQNLGKTYGELVGGWMPAHDLEPAADRPALEFYLDDPEEMSLEKMRTEIWMPLRS